MTYPDPQANPATAMLSAYRRQVDTCRKVADLMLDATGRLEQIGLNIARNALHGGLEAAGSLGGGQPAHAPSADQLMQFQREIGDTIGAFNGEMMRLMTDYGTQLAASLGAAAMPAGVPGVPGGPGFDALSRSWSDAMQRYNEMLRAMTSGNPTPKT